MMGGVISPSISLWFAESVSLSRGAAMASSVIFEERVEILSRFGHWTIFASGPSRRSFRRGENRLHLRENRG